MTRLDDTISDLRRLAHARRRDVDPEVRTITITDDDAADLVGYIDRLTDRIWSADNPELTP